MKILKHLILIASLTLCTTANAVSISTDFTATVDSGTFLGTIGTGTITYDDTDILGVGNEAINLNTALNFLTFNVFGQDFAGSDDIDFEFGTFPLVNFFDGLITSINYVVNELSTSNPTAINQAGVLSFSIFTLELGDLGGLSGVLNIEEGSISPVPVPAAAWLFGSGLIALFGFSRRRKSQI